VSVELSEGGHRAAPLVSSDGAADTWAGLVEPFHLEAARNIVFTNSKSLRDVGLQGAALYSFYSLMNHSCVANSSLTISKDLRWDWGTDRKDRR
jgi:hypothetical protein